MKTDFSKTKLKAFSYLLVLFALIGCQSPVEPLERTNLYDPESEVYKNQEPDVSPTYSAQDKSISFSIIPYERDTKGAVVEKSLQDSTFTRQAILSNDNLVYTDNSRNFSATTIFRLAEFYVLGSDTTFTKWAYFPINLNAPPVQVSNNGTNEFTWSAGHPFIEGYVISITSDVLPDSVIASAETSDRSYIFPEIATTPGFRFTGRVQAFVFHNGQKVFVTNGQSQLSLNKINDFAVSVAGIDSIKVSWNAKTSFNFELDLEISTTNNDVLEIIETVTVNTRWNPYYLQVPLSGEAIQNGISVRAVPKYQGNRSLSMSVLQSLRMDLQSPQLRVFSEGNQQIRVVLDNTNQVALSTLPPVAVSATVSELVVFRDTLWFSRNPQEHTLNIGTDVNDMIVEASFVYSSESSKVQLNRSVYLERETFDHVPSWNNFDPNKALRYYKNEIYFVVDLNLYHFDSESEQLTSLIAENKRRNAIIFHAGKAWQQITENTEITAIRFDGTEHSVTYRALNLVTQTDDIKTITFQGPATSELRFLVGSSDGKKLLLQYDVHFPEEYRYEMFEYILDIETKALTLLRSGNQYPIRRLRASNDRVFLYTNEETLVLDENFNTIATLQLPFTNLQYYPEYSLYIDYNFRRYIYDSNTGAVKAESVGGLLFPIGSETGVFGTRRTYSIGRFDADERQNVFTFEQYEGSTRHYFYSPKSGYLYFSSVDERDNQNELKFFRGRLVDGFTSQPIKRWP